MKAIDLTSNSEARELKALVFGLPGTGKTGLGVSAPRPLILLNERQAIPHIRAAAKRLAVPLPAVLLIESVQDYRNVLRALHGDRGKPFVVYGGTAENPVEVLRMEQWPESIVIDSATEACDLVAAEIREQSPPKAGRDGLPVDSERYWNVLKDRMAKLIRSFRDVPLNVLFLCLLEDKEIGEGDEKSRWVGPRLSMRAFPDLLAAAVNVVGITYRRRLDEMDEDGNRKLQYGVATTGPTYMLTKPLRPLRDNEVMDFASWCKRINGVDDGSAAPAPMDTPAVTAGDVTEPQRQKPRQRDADTSTTNTKPQRASDKPAA